MTFENYLGINYIHFSPILVTSSLRLLSSNILSFLSPLKQKTVHFGATRSHLICQVLVLLSEHYLPFSFWTAYLSTLKREAENSC
jgi:hypothetical protein